MSCSNKKETIQTLVEGGYCIGCGGCAFNNPEIEIKKNTAGLLYAETQTGAVGKGDACPFLSTRNETDISKEYYSKVDKISYEKRIGYYLGLYAGYVSEGGFRASGSSGGVVSWLLEQLMLRGEIDAVIHVGRTGEHGEIFNYSISRTVGEVRTKAKSQYYPTHFDKALEEVVADGHQKYAFVGIPCHVKAVRLLCERNHKLKNSIKFFLGIFCGHLKSTAFSELLAWQQGVKPDELRFIDFRVKNKDRKASNYSIKVEGDSYSPAPALNNSLYGTDWGLGLFKPKACDWCDDISAETADVVCGDAWLPEYAVDGMGTNIIIVRNPTIESILNEGRQQSSLYLATLTVEKIIESQAGNYRHRQEGLSVRIKHAERMNRWYPKKRVKADDYFLTEQREKIYLQRMAISDYSHKAFYEAKKNKSLILFFIKMLPYEVQYHRITKNLFRGLARSFFCHAKTVVRLYRKSK